MEKNAAKNHRFLDFPFVQLQLRCKRVPHRIACTPIPAAAPAYRAKTFSSRAVQGKCFTSYILLYSAARRAAPIYHSPPENATRSRVPRLNAPMGTPRPHVSRHVSGRAPRRGRRPRRPVFRSPIAGCTRVLHLPPVAIFLSTAKEIWKRTPPKTIGFWISLSSNCNCGAKEFRTESPALLSPLPLLRTARKLSPLAPYRGSALHPTYFYILRPEGPHLSITVRRKTPPAPASRD